MKLFVAAFFLSLLIPIGIASDQKPEIFDYDQHILQAAIPVVTAVTRSDADAISKLSGVSPSPAEVNDYLEHLFTLKGLLPFSKIKAKRISHWEFIGVNINNYPKPTATVIARIYFVTGDKGYYRDEHFNFIEKDKVWQWSKDWSIKP